MLNTNNYSSPWDGSFKGGLLPTSDYYYIINLNNGSKPLTGTLTIKR
jgi:gliding motility-associated-like protein